MKTKLLLTVTILASILLCSCQDHLPARNIELLIFGEDVTAVVEYYVGNGKKGEKCKLRTDTLVLNSYDSNVYFLNYIGTPNDNHYKTHPEYFEFTITRIRGEKPIYATPDPYVSVNGRPLSFIYLPWASGEDYALITNALPILEAITQQVPDVITKIDDNQPHIVEGSERRPYMPKITIDE